MTLKVVPGHPDPLGATSDSPVARTSQWPPAVMR